jgi:LCP family protein required for cell wall assembly
VRRAGLAAALVVGALLAALVADAGLLARRSPTVEVSLPGAGDGTAYLLLGSDSRGRLPEADRARYADRAQATGERADLVLVLRTGGEGPPRLLSIPRDLYVGRAAGRPHRLGLALADGPQAMVDSLCRDVGIGVDHVAVLDFRGLIDLVDATGGVVVTTDAPLRDRRAGLDLPRAGTQRLDGRQALAWVRSRQPEVLRDGRWQPAPGTDRTRTSHAVDVLAQALAGVDDPVTAHRVAWALAPRVRRDDGLGPAASVALARDLQAAVSAGRVDTVPVRLTETRVPVAFPTDGTEEALDAFRTATCRDRSDS